MAGLLLAGAVPAYAQHEQRYNPPGTGGDHELRFFDHADLSQYGTANRAKTGFWLQYDRLIWGFTGPDKTDIGNAAAAGTIVNNVTFFDPVNGPTAQQINFINDNTLDTGFANNDYVWGNRWEFGYMDDDDSGWMASIAHVHNYHPEVRARNATVAFGDPFGINSQFVDFNNDGIDDDINGNGVFGNNTPFNFDALPFPIPDGNLDTYVGPDFGDLISLPVSFGSIYAFQRTSYSSYEVNHVRRWDPLHSGATVEWLLGLRYTQISDDFNLFGSGGTGLITDMTIIGRTRNHLVGPQIGVRWNKQTGAWRLGAEGRFMAAANFQQAQVDSQFFGIAGSQLQSGTIVGGIDEATDTTWAPLGELRLDVAYQLTNAVSLRCGYTGLVAGGVGWASRRINYQLPQSLVLDENKSEAFIVNGFHFGVEINR